MRLDFTDLAKWGLVAAILVWWMVPPGGMDLDQECRPDSLHAQSSAAVTSDWFWRRQLDAFIKERDRWLAIQSKAMFKTDEKSLAESHLSRLVEPEQEEAARRFRQKRIVWLTGCIDTIQVRLSD